MGKKNKAPRKKNKTHPVYKKFCSWGSALLADDTVFNAESYANKKFNKLVKKGKVKVIELHRSPMIERMNCFKPEMFTFISALYGAEKNNEAEVKENIAVENKKTTTGVLFSQALKTLRIGSASFRYLRDELGIKPASRKGRGTYYSFDDVALIEALYKRKKANGTMPKLVQHYYDPFVDINQSKKDFLHYPETDIESDEPEKPEKITQTITTVKKTGTISLREIEEIDSQIESYEIEIVRLRATKKQILNDIMEKYKDE